MPNLMQRVGICAVLVSLLVHPAAGEGAQMPRRRSYPRAIALLDPQVCSSSQNLEVRGLLATALYLKGQRFHAGRLVLILHLWTRKGDRQLFLACLSAGSPSSRRSSILSRTRGPMGSCGSGKVARIASSTPMW